MLQEAIQIKRRCIYYSTKAVGIIEKAFLFKKSVNLYFRNTH